MFLTKAIDIAPFNKKEGRLAFVKRTLPPNLPPLPNLRENHKQITSNKIRTSQCPNTRLIYFTIETRNNRVLRS